MRKRIAEMAKAAYLKGYFGSSMHKLAEGKTHSRKELPKKDRRLANTVTEYLAYLAGAMPAVHSAKTAGQLAAALGIHAGIPGIAAAVTKTRTKEEQEKYDSEYRLRSLFGPVAFYESWKRFGAKVDGGE
jgi:hypothetical protein